MKCSVLVFLFFLAACNADAVKEKACEKEFQAYKPPDDLKKKDEFCKKYQNITQCFENANSTKTAFNLRSDLAMKEKNLTTFSCTTNCKAFKQVKDCHEKLVNHTNVGPKGRDNACLQYSEFVTCLKDKGECNAEQLKHEERLGDLITRNYQLQLCTGCKKTLDLKNCQKKLENITSSPNLDAAKRNETCKKYKEAEKCFLEKAECSLLATKQEMEKADRSQTFFACDTECKDFFAQRKTIADYFLKVFQTDDFSAARNNICDRIANGEVEKRFNESGCAGNEVENEIYRLERFLYDLHIDISCGVAPKPNSSNRLEFSTTVLLSVVFILFANK